MLNAALLEGHRPLGIALSGGSDSTALLILAAEALGAANLRAVTVDHGLRPEAQQEAQDAKTLCSSLGVAHETISINLQKGGDLQSRARTARYDALSQWAHKHGVSAIALGHTRDDLAETFLIRLVRGSGVDGLAAMPERFLRGDCTYLRPLLNAPRADLQALLRAKGIPWSDDPSNTDPAFTRVQIRQARPQLSELGLSTDRLAQTAHWMRAASEVLEDAADIWIAAHACAEHGDAVLDLAALRQAREETAFRVLARVLCNISGNAYRPRFDALKSLLSVSSAMTLHGCLAYIHKGKLRITAEPAVAQSAPNRWVISGPLALDHKISILGETGLTQLKNWRETALLPRRSLLASPAVWKGDSVIAAPLAQPDKQWGATAPNPLLLAK